jgi:hypothetical protein
VCSDLESLTVIVCIHTLYMDYKFVVLRLSMFFDFCLHGFCDENGIVG